MITLVWGALCKEGFLVVFDLTLGWQLLRAEVLQQVGEEVSGTIDEDTPVLSQHLLLF